MHMIWNMLVIKVNTTNAKKVDYVLDAVMNHIVKVTKWVLTYVPIL
jgi:hypothetical protein